MAKRRRRGSLAGAALRGALASVVGGLAMKAVWEAEQRALLSEPERVHSPTREAVRIVAGKRGVELSAAQEKAAAGAVYSGNMALFGALFGVVQSRAHPPALLHGLLLGGLVYGANFPSFGALPRLGIMQPPGRQPLRQAVVPIGAHVVYGLTTAAVFEALS